MYVDKHSIPPWLRNVYPFKSWLHNSEEPVITPYDTFHLRRGEYRILPNGIVVGRCRICGKPVISNIKRPERSGYYVGFIGKSRMKWNYLGHLIKQINCFIYIV